LGALTLASGTANVATTAVAWFGQTCGIYVVRSIKPGVTNKDTFIIAGRPIYNEIANAHPEVGDTAVREMYCPALDEIMRAHGWAFESWEGYF
jgi:hypothetical protein